MPAHPFSEDAYLNGCLTDPLTGSKAVSRNSLMEIVNKGDEEISRRRFTCFNPHLDDSDYPRTWTSKD